MGVCNLKTKTLGLVLILTLVVSVTSIVLAIIGYVQVKYARNIQVEVKRHVSNIAREDHFFTIQELYEDSLYQPKIHQKLSEPPDHPVLDCRMETCFNFTKCRFGFKIYIYPELDPPRPTTPMYSDILSIIRSSKYYTENITEACVFVLSVDTLNRDVLDPTHVPDLPEILKSLPTWNNGTNHLIFNMFSGTWPDYVEDELGFDVGKAILAKSSQTETYYRQGFDIAFPLIHKDHPLHDSANGYLISNTFPPTRKYTLAFKGKRYLTGIGSESRNALYHLHNNEDIILLTTCKHGKIPKHLYTERCRKDDEEYAKWDYDILLHNSTFCLTPRGRRADSFRFLESLQASCIPVILSNELMLPFSEVIDWKRAVVWADERLLFQIPTVVRSLSYSQILALRQQTQFLWDAYFSSLDKIVLTTLEVLRNRVHKRLTLPIHLPEIWNNLPGALMLDPEFSQSLSDYPFFWSSPAISQSRVVSTGNLSAGAVLDLPDAPPLVKYTALIYCYGNTSNSQLQALVKNLGKSKYIKEIVIQWQSKQLPMPAKSVFTVPKSVSINIVKIGTVHDSFSFSKTVSTPAVLRVESGVILSTDEVDFAFHVWQHFPQRIVGYPQATHYWDEKLKNWAFSMKWTNEYSMVLLSAAFYHRYYNHVYNNSIRSSPALQKIVNSCCNYCPSILMNFLVSRFTKLPPVKLSQRRYVREGAGRKLEEKLFSGLTQLKGETTCFQKLVEHFHTMPLHRSEVRLDPLLYKDAVSISRKRYRQMENHQ